MSTPVENHFFANQNLSYPQRLTAWWKLLRFHFRNPAKTSRDVLFSRESFFLIIRDEKNRIGIGEASPIPHLSREWSLPNAREKIAVKLTAITKKINSQANHSLSTKECIYCARKELTSFPSIAMALETAWLDILQGGEKIIFPSKFCQSEDSIKINGLVWMGDIQQIKRQIKNLLQRKFDCIKIKIGQHSIDQEVQIISKLRKENKDIVIRLDANGSFQTASHALRNIEKLAPYDIHSIEQPLPASFCDKNRFASVAREWKTLLAESPISIALDEELIGIAEGLGATEEKERLLENIDAPFLVLKPSLLGGFMVCEEWIKLAKKHGKKWWITSALESNIGLNAIAQWTYLTCKKNKSTLTQGLGTGELFYDNFDSPLKIDGKLLFFTQKKWNLSNILPY